MFPSYGKYIENIMKFSGYINRASILRLKCEKEVDLMVKFVADRQELVEDKKSMFGIYAPNVKLSAISPGLKTTFKHFITKVEELIPNLSNVLNGLHAVILNRALNRKRKQFVPQVVSRCPRRSS